MATWDCDKCGKKQIEQTERHCPDCGNLRFGRLQLAGDFGKINFGLDAAVGRALLVKISSQSACAAEPQFHIKFHDGRWHVTPAAHTPNATLLNGVEITEERELNKNDTLALGSRANTGKQALNLTIDIE